MKGRLAVAVGAVGVGLLIWWLAREHLALERLVEREQALRYAIDADRLGSWLLGFAVYTVVSLFPGTSGKSIIAGWLFGFWASLAMVTGALTLAAVGGFTLSRYLFQDSMRRRFGRFTDRLDRHVEREGAFYMLALRMMHVPYTLVNYTAGASSLAMTTFAWTTLVGLIPSTMVFVGVGASLPTLEQLLEHGASGLIDPILIAALVLMGVAPFLVRWGFKRFWPAAALPEESWKAGSGEREQ